MEQISTVSADGYDKLEMPLTLRVWKVSSCAAQLLSMQQEAEGELVPASRVPVSQLSSVHAEYADREL